MNRSLLYKTFILIGAMLLSNQYLVAQKQYEVSPFKGFHAGITGQMECIQKITFVPIWGECPVPKASPNWGWEAGVELSYHFAKYFGIAIGLNYGTVAAWNYKKYVPLENMEIFTDDTGYSLFPFNARHSIFVLPVCFEFHYPVAKRFYFTSSVGIKILGIMESFQSWEYHTFEHESWYGEDIMPDENDVLYYHTLFLSYPSAKVRADVTFNVGVYYQLPYSDLIRFTIGANLSFHDFATGFYTYPTEDSGGGIAIRNNFLAFQLAYIHTFNVEKMYRKVKKSGQTFASKKEKRTFIWEQLK